MKMRKKYSLPRSFKISFAPVGWRTFRLETFQILGLAPDQVFPFFENPKSLSLITPKWVDFVLLDPAMPHVFEGAVFNYNIRWLGVKIRWQSLIRNYLPPDEFTDVQSLGPYSSWVHRHTFEPVPDGTAMRDTVTYRLPVPAVPIHAPIIRPQLRDIFCYRSVMIDEWASRQKGLIKTLF